MGEQGLGRCRDIDERRHRRYCARAVVIQEGLCLFFRCWREEVNGVCGVGVSVGVDAGVRMRMRAPSLLYWLLVGSMPKKDGLKPSPLAVADCAVG